MLYNNYLANTKEHITESDLTAIEQKYKFQFPHEIKEHYLRYNGGTPKKSLFIDEDGYTFVVNNFLPIKYGNSTLEETLDFLRLDQILPEWLIPFADDPGGDLYCFSIDEEELGAIYYWSHEYDIEDDPEEHICYLCDSLTEFIEKLVNDEA